MSHANEGSVVSRPDSVGEGQVRSLPSAPTEPLPGWHIGTPPTRKEAQEWAKWHYTGTVGGFNRVHGIEDADGVRQVIITIGEGNILGVARKFGIQEWVGDKEIARIVAHPSAPRNAVSRALALVCKYEHAVNGLDWLFSYSDLGQRHHGGVYQAMNAVYVGLGARKVKPLWYLDGVLVHNRSINAKFATDPVPDGLKRFPPGEREKLMIQRATEQGHTIRREGVTDPKHTYILPIGSKATNRAIRKALEPFSKPYPKRRILMDIDIVRSAIVTSLTDADRKPKYQGNPNAMAGHCYVASEAAFHILGGREAGWTAVQIEHESDSHWFLRHDDGTVLDITADQFQTPVPYDEGRGRGFLTVQPSKRAERVMERANAILTESPIDRS